MTVMSTQPPLPAALVAGAVSIGQAVALVEDIAASFLFSVPLPPFPMHRAFPGSEYYGGSAPPGPFSRRCAYPATLTGCQRRGNCDRVVPVFTVARSTKEEPDCVPATSSQVRRRLSL